MKKSLCLLAVTVVQISVVDGAISAQQNDFEMRPGADYTDDTAVPQIIGGTKSDPANWPATFVFRNPRGAGCTSTAIGPRVILTAAHCIKNDANGIVKIGQTTTAATCQWHPAYHANVSPTDQHWAKKVSPDFALCALDAVLKNREFENINTNPNVPSKGSTIRLLGFGCNKTGGVDQNFGVLYEGNAGVTEVPNPPSYYTTTLGGAAVCYGDSGGGAYLYLSPGGVRLLVGINSRGDISTLSYLSSTGVPGFVSWAASWASQKGVRICGLHNDALGCRPK